MFKAILSASVLLFGVQAFAGGAVSWRNESLGFSINASKSSDTIEVCDSKDKCRSFLPVSDLGKKTIYKETNGKCVFSMEIADADHADGTTGEDFMLSVMYQVVRVKKEDAANCLMNASFGTKRTLTGIYGN